MESRKKAKLTTEVEALEPLERENVPDLPSDTASDSDGNQAPSDKGIEEEEYESEDETMDEVFYDSDDASGCDPLMQIVRPYKTVRKLCDLFETGVVSL